MLHCTTDFDAPTQAYEDATLGTCHRREVGSCSPPVALTPLLRQPELCQPNPAMGSARGGSIVAITVFPLGVVVLSSV